MCVTLQGSVARSKEVKGYRSSSLLNLVKELASLHLLRNIDWPAQRRSYLNQCVHKRFSKQASGQNGRSIGALLGNNNAFMYGAEVVSAECAQLYCAHFFFLFRRSMALRARAPAPSLRSSRSKSSAWGSYGTPVCSHTRPKSLPRLF